MVVWVISLTRFISSRNGGQGHILVLFRRLSERRSSSETFGGVERPAKKTKKKRDLALVSGISNASQPLDWWRPALFFSRRGYVSWNS
jgi:hypothetical protein